MGAVGFLARLEVRRRRWRAALLVVLIGVIAGTALAAAAGARRSASALDRFRETSRSADLELAVLGDPTAAQVHELRRIGDVEDVAALHAYGLVLPRVSSLEAIGSPADRTFGTRVDRGRIVAGRAIDPAAPDELAIGESLARRLHLGVGDSLRANSYSVAQIAAVLAGSEDVGPLAGPHVRLHVVGIVRRPLDLSDRAASGGFLVLSPTFATRYADRIGVFGTYLRIRTRTGAAGVPTAIAAARRVFGDAVLTGQGLTVETEGARDRDPHRHARALDGRRRGRGRGGRRLRSRAPSRDRVDLRRGLDAARALGTTRLQRIAASGPFALLVAGGSAIVAALTAVAASPLFPIGVARRAEPHVGVHADWVVLGLGAAVVLAVVCGIALLGAWLATSSASRASSARVRRSTPGLVGAATGAGMPPTATNGLRMALDRGRGRSAVPVRSAVVGAAIGVIGVVVVLVFASSLDHLATTPRLYGSTWDVTIRDTTANTVCGGDDYGVSRTTGLAALSEVCNQSVQVDRRPVAALAFTTVHGDAIGPEVLEGHAPRGPHEVALGSKTLDALGKDLGDTVRVAGRTARRAYTIVGRVALPTLGQAQPLADGATFTGAGFAPLFDQNVFQRYFAARFAPHADRATVSRRLAAIPEFGPPARVTCPVEVERVREVGWLPWFLGILLATLGLVAVGHAVVTSVRRRRHELAVLKTLGFDRRQVRATVAWQASSLGALGVVAGLPLGLLAGTLVWHGIATNLGVEPVTAFPVPALAATVAGALLLANLAALLPAAPRRDDPPGRRAAHGIGLSYRPAEAEGELASTSSRDRGRGFSAAVRYSQHPEGAGPFEVLAGRADVGDVDDVGLTLVRVAVDDRAGAGALRLRRRAGRVPASTRSPRPSG